MKYLLQFVALLILFTSCKTYTTKYPYSLDDFNPELRKHLELFVQYGGSCSVYTDSSFRYLVKTASLEDLKKFILSEHPILRAKAFATICAKSEPVKGYATVTDLSDSNFDKEQRRNSEIIDNLLLNHLDDTAIITYCAGEWGDKYIYVSDYYIDKCKQKTKIPDSILEDLIIKNYNYLNHAYEFIAYSNPKEKYYSIIKGIVIRENAWSRDDEYNILSALSDLKRKKIFL